jgi:hypothetical protein
MLKNIFFKDMILVVWKYVQMHQNTSLTTPDGQKYLLFLKFLLLLLLLNRLPPDITGGQGLNGFKELLFFTILQKNLIGEK